MGIFARHLDNTREHPVWYKNVWVNRQACALSMAMHPDTIRYAPDPSDLESARRVTWEGARRLTGPVGLVRDTDDAPYFTKFERFLKNNALAYEYFDIHRSDWLSRASTFTAVLWRPMSTAWELEEAREKIFFLERVLRKPVFPSFCQIMLYENKTLEWYLLKKNGFPVPATFISSDYEEAIAWIRGARYPFVSKIRAGSASGGVSLVRSRRQARLLVEQVFRTGKPTYWPFLKQKNYVFFQEFIPGAEADVRVIVVDRQNIFGYFRAVPEHDFRASGFGRIRFGPLPVEAVKLALDVKESLGVTPLAVDLLQSGTDRRFYVIEMSQFIKVDEPGELKLGGRWGRYRYDVLTGSLTFEPCLVWIQELALRAFFEMQFPDLSAACTRDRQAGSRVMPRLTGSP